MNLKPIFIEATTLSDAWFQTLYACVEHGNEFLIGQGSFEGQKRLEFDHVTVQIKMPWVEPLLPKINSALNIPDPVEEGYLDNYLPYLMTGEEKDGEAYTYGQRINKECCLNMRNSSNSTITRNLLISEYATKKDIHFITEESCDFFLSQVDLMIWTYKNKGYRNNQMILQVGKPTDMLLKDPPCLRHIDTRIQDGKLHFFPYFRSWDLFGGFPANLAAIELMKQYCAAEIGVDNGEIIASSKGLHIYDYTWELAELIRGRSIKEFKRDVRGNN